MLTEDFVKDKASILRFKRFVYISSKLRQHFVKEQHLLSAHGHQGIARTFERIARDYYFLGMRKYIEKVMGKCDLCARSKANRHAPYGLLQSLLTADRVWKSIAFDFIVKLSPSKELMTRTKFDAIWVVTDLCIKFEHFVSYKEGSNA